MECPKCAGYGNFPCWNCGGKGKISSGGGTFILTVGTLSSYYDEAKHTRDCETCHGKGRIDCSTCNGTGVIPDKE